MRYVWAHGGGAGLDGFQGKKPAFAHQATVLGMEPHMGGFKPYALSQRGSARL
jgi:hypothetical protein